MIHSNHPERSGQKLTKIKTGFECCLCRSLKCDRTRIHRNLFIAIIIHVLVSLCMHIDEFIAKSQGTQVGGSVVDDKGTLSNTVRDKACCVPA